MSALVYEYNEISKLNKAVKERVGQISRGLIPTALLQNNDVDAFYLDFSKAFEAIYHSILWGKTGCTAVAWIDGSRPIV